MTWTAVEVMDRVFHPGLRYTMAEVLLGTLCEKGEHTDDLFPSPNPSLQKKSMNVLDFINEQWGRGVLCLVNVPTNPDWGEPGDDEPELHDSD